MAQFAAHTAETISRLNAGVVPQQAKFTIEQQVTEGDLIVDHFHVKIASGAARVIEGPANEPDITIRQDRETARALRAGEIHAQRAFLTGQLEINGDIDRLLEHGELLGHLLQGRDA